MNESFVRGEVNEVQAIEGRDLEGGDDTVALLK